MSGEHQQLMGYLLSVVDGIVTGKRKDGREPSDAGIEEIMAKVGGDVRMCLNEMVRDGILGFHRTLNSISFHFKNIDNNGKPD